MNQPDIQHLIMQDLKFKMSTWRIIAITALILFSGTVGLFISSDAELKNAKAKLNATHSCQK
jgi:hypothetical protein|nr:MAG TPA: protein of unknown function (DUF4713) [Caudoviricetes sp.]